MTSALDILIQIGSNEETAFKFCIERGLLKEKVECPYHAGEILHIKPRLDRKNAPWTFRCRDGRRLSIKRGTIFEFSSLPMNKILRLAAMWCFKTSQKEIMKQVHVSQHTVVEWTEFFRFVCRKQMEMELQKSLIGGPGTTVEIDETLISKRKYHRGRILAGQQWVIGGVCRETKAMFIVPCEDRTAITCSDIISKHVMTGTHIITDGWKAYGGLKNLGYSHSTVNHSLYFVDPETGACTNTVENIWRWLKNDMPTTGTRRRKLEGYLYKHI